MRAEEMAARGVEIIALASCVKNGNPLCFPCPHADTIKVAMEKKIGDKVKILDYTH